MAWYGVDFGANDALAIHGPEGPVPPPKLPRVRGGASVSDKFIRTLPILLETHNVAVESATVGASGVEPHDVTAIVDASRNNLYTVSNRATKNWKRDYQLEWDKGARYAKDGDPDPTPIDIHLQENVHAGDAEIIYTIAVKSPARLRLWEQNNDRLTRIHTSVRPHDKRNYRGPIPDAWMDRLPPFETLPYNLQVMLGNGVGSRHPDYSRARAMPLAMAMDEPGVETRRGYEKVIGLCEHGYPSYYRRNTVVLMQVEAKLLAGVTRIGDVSPAVRKEAWRKTRRNIRQIYDILAG